MGFLDDVFGKNDDEQVVNQARRQAGMSDVFGGEQEPTGRPEAREFSNRHKQKAVLRAARLAERLPEDFSTPGVFFGRRYLVRWSRTPYGKVKKKSFRSARDAELFAKTKGGIMSDSRGGDVLWPVGDDAGQGKPSDGGHIWWGWGG